MLVVDSCVLIHLARIGRLDFLRAADTCCTTEDIYRETVIEGQRGSSQIAEAFRVWLARESVDERTALKIAAEEGIEKADATLILLADKTNGTLLTNDKALIYVARSRNVECMWLTSLLLRLCKTKRLSKEEALHILYELVQAGLNIETKVYGILEKKLESMNE